MDALKLNMIVIDQIHPLLSDLVLALHKSNVAKTYRGVDKIKEWLVTLNARKASDEMSNDQTRQLMFDLEGFVYIKNGFHNSAHAEFHRCLGQ
jgi:ESCRT-I complex subunit VPS28